MPLLLVVDRCSAHNAHSTGDGHRESDCRPRHFTTGGSPKGTPSRDTNRSRHRTTESGAQDRESRRSQLRGQVASATFTAMEMNQMLDRIRAGWQGMCRSTLRRSANPPHGGVPSGTGRRRRSSSAISDTECPLRRTTCCARAPWGSWWPCFCCAAGCSSSGDRPDATDLVVAASLELTGPSPTSAPRTSAVCGSNWNSSIPAECCVVESCG